MAATPLILFLLTVLSVGMDLDTAGAAVMDGVDLRIIGFAFSGSFPSTTRVSDVLRLLIKLVLISLGLSSGSFVSIDVLMCCGVLGASSVLRLGVKMESNESAISSQVSSVSASKKDWDFSDARASSCSGLAGAVMRLKFPSLFSWLS